jgi:hypothetical protein
MTINDLCGFAATNEPMKKKNLGKVADVEAIK